METASPFETAKSRANERDRALACGVDVFLETLRDEQNDFLNAVGNARSLLGSESGQLARLSATHVRLTRQFFDAQRSIMLRRAEVDAEVASIAQQADEKAAAALLTARTQVVAEPRWAPPPIVNSAVTDDTVRLLGLRTPGLRRGQEVNSDSFACVIDEVFQPNETDGSAAQRQLAALVDEWWSIEALEGKALIDDAHARAAVLQHRADVEASRILAALPCETEFRWLSMEPPTPSAPISPQIRAFLDSGDATSIETLLATLLSALESSPTPSVVEEQEFVISFAGAPTDVPVSSTPPEEVFRRFWSHGSHSARTSSGWRWLPSRVVLPMTAATSGLVLVMAWIG